MCLGPRLRPTLNQLHYAGTRARALSAGGAQRRGSARGRFGAERRRPGLGIDQLSHRRRPGELPIRETHRTAWVTTVAPANACGTCIAAVCVRGARGPCCTVHTARLRAALTQSSSSQQHKIVTSPSVTVAGNKALIKFETLYRSGDTYGTLSQHDVMASVTLAVPDDSPEL